jgi:hypothetical protein
MAQGPVSGVTISIAHGSRHLIRGARPMDRVEAASVRPFSGGNAAHHAVPPLVYKIINKYAEIVGVGQGQ